ncbi:MAG: glutathione S-transferase family protein [Planctomycetes bacterium]|nr:glutathione S-transferase family protein [Planctomycetota bacterium]
MILFYSPGACSFAELAVLPKLGLPFRLCRVTRDERQAPPYTTAVNPHGQVPAMIVGGEVLVENAALLNLLGDLRPELGLLPRHGTRERRLVDQWLSWLDSGFHSAHVPMFKPQRFAPDAATQAIVKAHAIRGIRAVLSELDTHLRGREHVLLPYPNVLDGYVVAMARWSAKWVDHATEVPHLHAFLRRMDDDPGVRFAKAVEAGEIVASAAGAPSFGGHVSLADAIATIRVAIARR